MFIAYGQAGTAVRTQATGGALTLVLAFGMMLYNTNSQMAAIGGEASILLRSRDSADRL